MEQAELQTKRLQHGVVSCADLAPPARHAVAIARTLILEPALLLLDEPTEGIQPNIVQEIGDVILRLNSQLGLTVLIVEQKLPFARRVASEFVVLDKGGCARRGPIADLTEEVVRAHLSV